MFSDRLEVSSVWNEAWPDELAVYIYWHQAFLDWNEGASDCVEAWDAGVEAIKTCFVGNSFSGGGSFEHSIWWMWRIRFSRFEDGIVHVVAQVVFAFVH